MPDNKATVKYQIMNAYLKTASLFYKLTPPEFV